jgi:uncharacterized protein YifN (PemK superfamily)
VPITFTPKRAHILICDFDMACVPPEMRKVRRVVVLSNRSSNKSGRAVVVPFSGTAPRIDLPSHVPFAASSYRSFGVPVWAICDCIAHVSFRRLDRVFNRGAFLAAEALRDDDMARIEVGLRHTLGFRH